MKDLKAKHIMNKNIISVSETMSLTQLASVLREKEISGAPVVNKHGKVVGVVSLSDIVSVSTDQTNIKSAARQTSAFYDRSWDELSQIDEVVHMHAEKNDLEVSDIMTPAVYSIDQDTSVIKAAKTMLAGRIHRLLVTDDEKYVGLISTTDFLKVISELG